MSGTALRVEALVRDFGRVRALDGLTFEVPSGMVFGFLGPNGAGKTTVIRVLLGLLDPTSGSTQVFGLDSRRQGDSVRQRSGALLEHHGLYERLSAAQNLDFHARAWRMPGAQRRARIRELLSQFGLWERKDDIVGTWSRGMKQKLAVARAVLHRPPLVFLDEPTAGLDPVASASLRDDLARLTQQEGVTIFLTTHNLPEAERLCGLVGVIRKGRLMGFGTPASLRGAHGSPLLQVRGRGFSDAVLESLGALGASGAIGGIESVERREDGVGIRLSPDASAAPLVAWLVAQGVEIEEVRRDRASFEDAFLDLVTQEGAGGSA